jgi:hypothetical protein
MLVVSADLYSQGNCLFNFFKEEPVLFRAFICRAKNVKANIGQLMREQMCLCPK